MGVIHHVPDTERAVAEFHRVLRPGGRAIVMVYHRDSFNYHFTIMALKRTLALLLFAPGSDRLVSRVSGESPELLAAHRALLRKHGLRYLRDRQLFLNHNTDGPGNPLSKVYSREEARELFAPFAQVRTAVRFVHLRSYPGASRVARSELARRMGAKWGWHLWVEAVKQPAPPRRL
jgi:SAM-dependent methyltransferase